MGALDVCPFIPVRGVSMDECVLCAQAFGQRLAEELDVPGECAPPSLFHSRLIGAGYWLLMCPAVPCPWLLLQGQSVTESQYVEAQLPQY